MTWKVPFQSLELSVFALFVSFFPWSSASLSSSPCKSHVSSGAGGGTNPHTAFLSFFFKVRRVSHLLRIDFPPIVDFLLLFLFCFLIPFPPRSGAFPRPLWFNPDLYILN